MNELRKILSSSPQREKIERLIKRSPAPALARSNFLRLIEAGGLKSLKRHPEEYLPSLFRLLGGSAYLSDILIREGKKWPDLFLSQIEVTQKTASDHLRELSLLLKRESSFDDLCRALRRYKQREFVRIGARDLLASVTVEETMRELTALAEAALEVAYRFCRSEVERDFGELRPAGTDRKSRFVIIGMGKLGGEELNFSSDIDIIYLYEDDENESEGGCKDKATPRQFFTYLAERMTRAMGDVTEDGFVFRTDLRLRPLGRNGPLVQSVDSALLYYESWGQCWERAALIKARPVAGDAALGVQFLRDLQPFIYRRYLDFTTVEELRHMKMRIEQELLTPKERKRNLKLGRGGIREIEFFTQALQLVNGGYEPTLRDRNTLRGLDLLARYGYIPAREKEGLSRAYRFLRDVEHKIQMIQQAHAHSIPDGDEEMRALARRLGYSQGRGQSEPRLFWQDFRKHTQRVRQAFDRLFYQAQRDIQTAGTSVPGELWKDLDQEELALNELNRLGFSDPQRSYDNLLAVRDGEPYSPPSARRHQVMRILGPALIAEIMKSNSPDQALFNLSQFSHRLGARTGFLSLLAENPKTLRLLITLFSTSQFLSDLFLKRPELIDSLIRVDLSELRKTKKKMTGELVTVLNEIADLEVQLDAIRRYKAEEFLRIGLHDLGGALKLEEVITQLSDLAEACLEGAFRLSAKELQKNLGEVRGGQFAVLGMGKLGGREIDYNSDLDLIFIYDAPEDSRSEGDSGRLPAHDYYVRLGQKLITFLSVPTAEGVAYKIDMRLRPSGRSGPLVSSLEAFRHYHQTSSLLWERQALIKARGVAGDRGLGAKAEAIAESFAYGGGLTPEGVAEIHHLRMRMEKELAQEDHSHFNLKKGKGGMVDIEFLAQMLQLSHGHDNSSLRQRGTLAALKALKEKRILKKREYDLLSQSYLFLRRLDHRLRLERDQSIDIVERENEKLHGIARVLGYGSRDAGTRLLRDYEVMRDRIRACYYGFFLPRHVLRSKKIF